MKEVEEYIYKFLQCVIEFHDYLIKEYKLEEYPTYNEAGRIFPRSNIFFLNERTFNYRYHGSGCTLMIDDVIIDYDIDILSKNKIKISSWKFNRFIESYSKSSSAILVDDLDEIFINLTQKGVLLQKNSELFVFTINESFFMIS